MMKKPLFEGKKFRSEKRTGPPPARGSADRSAKSFDPVRTGPHFGQPWIFHKSFFLEIYWLIQFVLYENKTSRN